MRQFCFETLKPQLIKASVLCVIFYFIAAYPSFAQERSAVIEGFVHVKLTESAKKQFVGAGNGLPRNVAKARTGVQTLDQLAQQYDVVRMERVFRPAGIHEARHIEWGLDRWYKLRYRTEDNPHAVAKSFAEIDGVETSSPVYKIIPEAIPRVRDEQRRSSPSANEFAETQVSGSFAIPNDPEYDVQWHYNNTNVDADINLPQAHNLETGNPEVVISICDNGTDVSHPDLENMLWINEEEDINGNGRFDPYPEDEGGDFNGEDDDENGFIDDVVGYDTTDDDPDPSPEPGDYQIGRAHV